MERVIGGPHVLAAAGYRVGLLRGVVFNGTRMQHCAYVAVGFKDSSRVCRVGGLQSGSLGGDVVSCCERHRENAGDGENLCERGGPLRKFFPMRLLPMQRLGKSFLFHRALLYVRWGNETLGCF